jgi:hypothetical protein
LRQLYNSEKQCLIKKGYKLSHKSLYPNNLERQKVGLVDNRFHHSTIAAVQDCREYEETAMFLEIIKKWWDTVTTKSTFLGVMKRNDWSGPISDINDEKVIFLKTFVSWIQNWNLQCQQNICTGLYKDTFEALERSIKVLIDLIHYSLET